jgi:aryl-alcohol dehydrogenase-like predicted oxidoreductase
MPGPIAVPVGALADPEFPPPNRGARLGLSNFAALLTGSIPGVPVALARLVLGTDALAAPGREADAAPLLDAAFARGVNAFDTAHLYGDGAAERALGAWVEARGVRDRVVLITKGGHAEGPPGAERSTLNRAEVGRQLAESLDRLRTSTVDLYLLHRDDPAVPAAELVELAAEHVAAGRTRAIGVSNWSLDRILAANAHAAARGLPRFVVTSPYFGLAVPRRAPFPGAVSLAGADARDERRRCAREGIAVLAWSCRAKGWFAGRWAAAPPPADDLLGTYVHDLFATPANEARRQRAARLAARRGCTADQVAIAYVLRQPLEIFAAFATARAERLDAIVAAAAIPLTSAELTWLEEGAGDPPDA